MCIKVGKKPGIICVHRPLTYTHVRASSTVLCGIYHYFGLVYNRGQQYQFVEGQYQYQYLQRAKVNTQYQYQYSFCQKVNTNINTNTASKSYTLTLLPTLCY